MTKGLHNIQSLTLKAYTLVEIQRFNESHSLKEFTLEFCDDGGRFGVNELPVDTNYNEQFRIVYDEKTKWLTRNKFPLRWSFKRQDSSTLLSLVQLKLYGDFSSTRLDLETIANIEDVELSHCDGSAGVASLPVFRGKRLRLYGFQLPLWTHDEEMARVEELFLVDCTLQNNDRGDSFPSMPNVRKLELQRVRNLRWLRTFPRARFLRLSGLPLQYISPQPSLKELEIVCSATDCPSLDGQAFYSVQIISREIPEIAWARNSYKVSLQGYDNARNLLDLMLNSSLPLDRRECFISDMKNVDLSPQSNWRKVTVVDVRTFGDEHDRTRLSNIEELKISSCRNYLSTSNLHNIKRRLEISNCRSLAALKGLQQIPEVILTSLPGLTDFTGLGFHERVVVDDVPVLAQAAEQYAKTKCSGREEHVPHREIFGSIKSFTVLSKDGGGYTISKTLW